MGRRRLGLLDEADANAVLAKQRSRSAAVVLSCVAVTAGSLLLGHKGPSCVPLGKVNSRLENLLIDKFAGPESVRSRVRAAVAKHVRTREPLRLSLVGDAKPLAEVIAESFGCATWVRLPDVPEGDVVVAVGNGTVASDAAVILQLGDSMYPQIHVPELTGSDIDDAVRIYLHSEAIAVRDALRWEDHVRWLGGFEVHDHLTDFLRSLTNRDAISSFFTKCLDLDDLLGLLRRRRPHPSSSSDVVCNVLLTLVVESSSCEPKLLCPSS